ncbi:hypothetical protein [Candidatus Methylacidithermus pantelleriae]|nr:hypothetical protein [Candidatus Methylacidithermus pantelleriae]
MVKSAFFAAGVEAIEVDQAYAFRIGAVNPRVVMAEASRQGAISCGRSERVGIVRTPMRARGSRA